MNAKVGKFSFTVPENSPVEQERGKKIEKSFEYQEVQTESEARNVLETRKWNLIELVNENLKSLARSNAYQNALMPHKPSEVAPEDIKERMIRDYIRLGIPESTARQQVEALLSAAKV